MDFHGAASTLLYLMGVRDPIGVGSGSFTST